jgi:hypothetical protein
LLGALDHISATGITDDLSCSPQGSRIEMRIKLIEDQKKRPESECSNEGYQCLFSPG